MREGADTDMVLADLNAILRISVIEPLETVKSITISNVKPVNINWAP
jgi:hypothetical protein